MKPSDPSILVPQQWKKTYLQLSSAFKKIISNTNPQKRNAIFPNVFHIWQVWGGREKGTYLSGVTTVNSLENNHTDFPSINCLNIHMYVRLLFTEIGSYITA